MIVRRMDHVGINVQDLSAAVAFFQELGLEVQGQMDMEGEFVESIIGLRGVKDTIVMLGIPGGPSVVELVKFMTPVDANGLQPSYANTLGIRHLCFNVDDVEDAVARLQKRGAELVGGIRTYENIYKLCYIRGPEGILLELAEELTAPRGTPRKTG